MFRTSVGVVFVFVVGAAAGATEVAAQDHPGAKVYAAQKCSICHAIAGAGNKKFPLDGVGARLTADQIREWIVAPRDAAKKAGSSAKPAMRAYPTLPAADLDALVAYMASLKE